MATKKTTQQKKNQINPLGDRVLIEPITEEAKTATGIIIPDSAQQKKQGQGKVVAVGKGKIGDDGKMIPMQVKVGDIVVFSEYSGENIKVDGKEYYIVGEGNILAVIK